MNAPAELKASIGRCEEASPLSGTRYVPCNAPAVQMVYSITDRREYRMCAPCAHHNLHNRGFKDAGPYTGPTAQPLGGERPAPAAVPGLGSALSDADLSAYVEDASLTQEAEAENILARITNTVAELREAQARVTERQELLDEAAGRVRVLEEITLPELMREAKQEKLRTLDGYDVELTETLRASIPPANLIEAIRWLVEHNQQGIIKREIKLQFGKGEDERARHLLDIILPEGYAPEDKQAVHPQTLAATIRELVTSGVEVPMKLLGAVVLPKVKIKEAKPSKR